MSREIFISQKENVIINLRHKFYILPLTWLPGVLICDCEKYDHHQIYLSGVDVKKNRSVWSLEYYIYQQSMNVSLCEDTRTTFRGESGLATAGFSWGHICQAKLGSEMREEKWFGSPYIT